MPATPAAPGAGGVLRPGDLVRLRIWREPDLSGDFQVDDRGSAVFPKIGPVHVASISADSLKSMLIGVYSTYLRNPSIDVTLLRRVNVLGSVRNPGLYPVDATMTVADALALAGGVTTEGDQNKLDLRRDGRTLRADLSQRTRIGDSPIRSGDQLYVPQRSWMSRNTGVVTALISATGFLAATLIAR
jgi:polysaccharide export outer membrane protein